MSSASISITATFKVIPLPVLSGTFTATGTTPSNYAIGAASYGDYSYYATSGGYLNRFRLSTNTMDNPINAMSGINQYPSGTRYNNQYLIVGGVGPLSSTVYSYDMVANGTTVTTLTSYPVGTGRGAGGFINGRAYILGGSIDTGDSGSTTSYYYNGSTWTAGVTLPASAGGLAYTTHYSDSNPAITDKIYFWTKSNNSYSFDGTSYTLVSSTIPNGGNAVASGIGNNYVFAIGSDNNTIYYRKKNSGTSDAWTLLGSLASTNQYPMVAISNTGSSIVVGFGGFTNTNTYKVITNA